MLIETIALGITFAQAWKANDLDNKSLNTLMPVFVSWSTGKKESYPLE